jgi:putative solute:sodium symporter small subunit
MASEKHRAYWRKNLGYLAILLSIWFLVSFGAGIIFADTLNQWHIGGAKLGFWMAQQGALYVFVLIILAYIYLMNKLDHEYDVEE